MILSLINFLACKSLNPFVNFKGTTLYNFWMRGDKRSAVTLRNSSLKNTRLHIAGVKNEIKITNAKASDSIITVTGNNNKLLLEKGVDLRKSNIIIRGNNCKVQILQGTTFGSVRIVNVGSNNAIIIGRNCLFSDHIEIWASDTHAIYDENKNWINQEQPVTIGDEVWVGSHVKILKGVKIGKGAILGMGAVVTKDVPERVIAAGTPAGVIKNNVSWSLDYPLA
ncbi:acyltransferase [uncultured Zobellia sp.]|uniref:acyltransferase n=1 Tax=uncultured Zobellia sp. TaxID=255433 RepID=UPI0025970CF8|nr:acyltransferase [uncultured Zobellia sp.]